MTDAIDLSIAELDRRLERRDLSALELLELAFARIDQQAELNTFVRLDREHARACALESDRRAATGERRSALDGVPIALKDNMLTAGRETTAGSRILEGFVPPYSAAVAERLEAEGALLVGKTNMDEFAMGSSNEHSAYGPVKNPWAPSHVPGGSSGGSAASVAARQVAGSLGTDTGGSIRLPAAFCGVLGLKPTYGRVSRHGVVAYASSLDQVGPFARSTEDLAILLKAIAGFDERDSTSAQEAVPDYRAELEAGVEGLNIGLPEEYFVPGIDPEVEESVRAAARALESAGARLRPVSLPHTKYALSAYYLIATAEASSNLARYDGVRYGRRVEDSDLRRMIVRTRHEGFGEEVQRRILLGTYVLSAGYYEAYYGRAQKVRTLIRRDFERAFGEVDLLLTPTAPSTAFELGARLVDPLSMYLTDVCTLSVNLAGVPALSAPAGFSKSGLPIGFQLIGRWFEEARLLAAARVHEVEKGFGQRSPVESLTAPSP